MAARGKTVDPAAITTIEEWARAYGKYSNIVLDNGTPAVLDRVDKSAVVKRLPLKKGDDLYVVLQGSDGLQGSDRLQGSDGELRNTALETLEEKEVVIKAAVTEAIPGFIEAEKQLLEATDAWNLARTDVARAAAALEVGRRSVTLVTADHVLRTAAAPRRFIMSISDLTRRDLDYRTQDDRSMGNVLTSLKNVRLNAEDRILTEEGRA